MSALDAEILLRAAGREAEADEHLVEDQHDAALAADGAQPLEPIGVGRPVEMGAAAAVDQRRSRPAAPAFGCSACSGLTSTQAMSRRVRSTRSVSLRHVGQRVGFARAAADCRRPAARRPTSRDRRRRTAPGACAACGSAPAAPPASPPRCPTCGTTPRRGPEICAQPLHVVGDHRVIGAEHRPELAHAPSPRSMHSL